MHPRKMLGDITRLVRLNGADEVPTQGQVGQFDLFGAGFLQVVLAKVANPGGMGLTQRGGRLGLADRE